MNAIENSVECPGGNKWMAGVIIGVRAYSQVRDGIAITGMPVLAETAAAVSALSGGGWQAGLMGCLRGWHTGFIFPALPDQTAVDGSGTLSWLLTPLGMVALAAGWPGTAAVG